MLLLGEKDVRRALNLKECILMNKKALVAVSDGSAMVPSRLALPYYPATSTTSSSTDSAPAAADWTLIKPAAFYESSASTLSSSSSSSSAMMGMKVVSVRAQNPSNGLPLVPATVLLLDAATGMLEATISGTYLTVARTSAGPAIAVQTFRPDVDHLVVFGAGAQAESHIELIELAIERTIPRITIVNRSRPRAEALKEKIVASKTQGDQDVRVLLLDDTENVNEALSSADVIATTTNATKPLWEDGSILKKGCLITSIGSYTPDMQEVPVSAVDRCQIYIDTPEAMAVGDLKHLGDFQTSSQPITLIGATLADSSIAREEHFKGSDLIFYKAVGTAIQDVLTATVVVQRARALGIGLEVEMS